MMETVAVNIVLLLFDPGIVRFVCSNSLHAMPLTNVFEQMGLVYSTLTCPCSPDLCMYDGIETSFYSLMM